jgi:FAD/FMN-containing dehydrogenase
MLGAGPDTEKLLDELVVEHAVVVGPDASAAERRASGRWPAGSWAAVRPWGYGGVYPNFPDPDLDDWAHAYYGANDGRLRRVKRRYDPDNVFRSPQSVTAEAAR